MSNKEIVRELAATYRIEDGIENEELITLDVFKTALDMVKDKELEVVVHTCEPDFEDEDEIDGTIYISDVDGISGLLHFMSSALLINRNGSVDNDAVSEIIKYGYNVFPGEKDLFGWLTGCVEVDSKIIVFG